MAGDIGTSTLYSTEWVIEQLREVKPSSIIDIGCGWGRWGFLAREFLELWSHRFARDSWKVRIDALDVNPSTWTPVHAYIYDSALQVDVRTWVPSQRYDVAICCDVLEHMDKEDGLKTLGKLLAWCDHVLLGVPLGAGWERPGFDGNPYEAHLARWEASDLEPYNITAHKLTQTEDGLGYGLFHILG